MKISYYIDSVIPSQKANTVHVVRMCQAFVNNGITTTLVCDSDEKSGSIDDIWSRYGINEKFDIKRAFIRSNIRKMGHRVVADFSAWKKSRIKVNADISYARSAMTLFFLRKSRPYIYEAHMEPDMTGKIIVKKILRHPNCIGVVVISKALKNRFIELFPFFPSEKIYVLHDAADIDVSNSEIKAKLDSEGLKVGYLGHLYPGKCMETLMPIAKRCPDIIFHIVGGTEQWVNHWKAACKINNINNIRFYGFVNNSEIGNYYRAFDVCILPFSNNVFIGKNKKANIGKWISPLKLFEAMSYSKPILVSDIPTIREVMEDNVDCLFADPNNPEEWVKKLTLLLQDDELRYRLGNAAYKKLESQYTWDIRVKKIINIINDAH